MIYLFLLLHAVGFLEHLRIKCVFSLLPVGCGSNLDLRLVWAEVLLREHRRSSNVNHLKTIATDWKIHKVWFAMSCFGNFDRQQHELKVFGDSCFLINRNVFLESSF